MSEVEIHIGKVRKIDLNGTPIDTWCKNKCEELGIELRSWHDGYIDALQDETSYLVHKGNVYDVDDKEYEEYNDISEIYPNNDGSYSYVMKFYNGGTCLSGCLLSKLNNLTDEQN